MKVDFTRFSSRFVQQLPTVIKVPLRLKKGEEPGMRKLDSPRLGIGLCLHISRHIRKYSQVVKIASFLIMGRVRQFTLESEDCLFTTRFEASEFIGTFGTFLTFGHFEAFKILETFRKFGTMKMNFWNFSTFGSI